ncbi:hypothetical protein SLS60_002946 [Paraconiothyrium brasiliense]|uniref:Major facilitator superfamily (MFS) profile domain-containing protein n=1 Tax=Paraconiothyrium brasiliense TaxID=300254 RepID=A0ABR3RVM7_9PLEO
MQPLYGKLSDIYGRKSLLLVAYVLFATGCAVVGVAQSMGHAILGRVISGLGASGMTALVSVLITDLVPLRDVATWRSYVNIAATTGRSIGGPLGGWLADTLMFAIPLTGRYKSITLLAILAACGGYLLLILRWHGHTNWLESLYIMPGGFAMGVASSTLFISVQASIDPAHSAVAASTLYLASAIGAVIGMAASSAVLQGSLRLILDRKLSSGGFEGLKKMKIIIETAMSQLLRPLIRQAPLDVENPTHTLRRILVDPPFITN